MAQNQKKKQTAKKQAPKRSSKGEEARKARAKEQKQHFSEQYMPYIWGALAFLLAFFFILSLFAGEEPDDHLAGPFGFYFTQVFFGLFGWAAFLIPVLMGYLAGFWRKNCREGTAVLRSVLSLVLILLLSAVIHVFVCGADESFAEFDISMLYTTGATFASGGVIGGTIGLGLFHLLKVGGTIAVSVVVFPLLIMILIGVTPAYVASKIKEKVKAAKEAKEAEEDEDEDEEEDEEEELQVKPRRHVKEATYDREEQPKKKRTAQEAEDQDDDAEEVQMPPKRNQNRRDRSTDADEPVVRVNTQTGEVVEDEVDSQDQDAHVQEEQNPELYVPHRLSARDRRAAREQRVQNQPPSRRDMMQEQDRGDDGYYADDEPQDTDTMEISMEESYTSVAQDQEEGELRIPPRRGQAPQTATHPPQETTPERERIVVVVHEQDRTAVTSTVDHHVDGLADEEVVLPSGTGEVAVEAKSEYSFPPIELLTRGNDRYVADEDEISRNTETLREVLESFHIRVKEVSCSCGPTITRFEVKPDQGVRVRSIANLVDDIALGLAKSGVRIEAPIPGKAAVGIEVPCEHPATVYLRNLIETPEFQNHKSPIASCLGADVSGRPVIFDINKMPHLLVAGATGMGKSVCINSIIMSILYKATPEEVKLILIDPKKVEFTMYRELPHLYAPIVSDPKKAAGCLNSAVNEMERRFELIEEMGVRNITGYNEVIADDPTRQPLPRLVIIIDEFADLMMTASQEVETAVCRLAQKARAAGIHLIIGTQRPSVDVITGLIKANIPSRIAFTVASARDSMTILDMGGADKLIGRGDMLYAPVGAAKPMRVQGTFVSDGEVERVVTYIKEHNSQVVFDESFIKDIELEAAKCGNGKKKGGETAGDFDALGSSDGLDEKYWAAVEVAVEEKKISTSLLQRRLNLGFGRAARIIDQMEEMGFVSAKDGQKPRNTLITAQDLAEIRISGRAETDSEG